MGLKPGEFLFLDVGSIWFPGPSPGFCIADLPSEAAGVEETIERAEDTIEARGRLAQLKPAERRALVLIAAGFSYKEIGELNRWSYTKVNRSAAEGRAALRAALAP